MRIYYAHSMHLYGKPQEKRDIEMLEKLGFEVLNPNNEECIKMCKDVKEHGEKHLFTKDQISSIIMDNFKDYVLSCKAVAFRAHLDGKIPAGVGKEVLWAKEAGLPIIELPSLFNSKFLEVGETRQYLEYLGER
jgi:hypothetical protein